MGLLQDLKICPTERISQLLAKAEQYNLGNGHVALTNLISFRQKLIIAFYYLQMKPATLIHTTPEDLQRATELAGHVAYLVNQFQMQKQVLINSFDITKSLVVKNVRLC